jgi:transposase
MTKATTIGLDIAKQVFQVHGSDRFGRAVMRRKLRRSEVARFFSEQPPCLIGIEASGSAHHWARVLGGLGHTVRLMAPQFVKPYVKSNKNDANDAEAICEAVTRPSMRFVPQKSVEQQDLQCLHRVRSRLVACRTQLINQIRGLLAEYGIVLPQHPGQVRRGLPTVLEDAENQLTGFGRELFQGLYEELVQLDEKVGDADKRIQIAFQRTPNCQRIAAVEGVGPLIATAIVAAISNGHAFENGRQFSTWLGLVPRRTPVAERVDCWGSASAAIHT